MCLCVQIFYETRRISISEKMMDYSNKDSDTIN